MVELPVAFAERMQKWLGPEYDELEQALGKEAPASIRLNPLKPVGVSKRFEKIPWTESGYYLPERYPFTFDPLFHGGAYYVQEASSMFLEQVIRQFVTEPVRFLDLCAAPGGKTTHAVSVLPAGSLVVSNEIVRNRAAVLVENVVKWGSAFQIVTRNEPADFGGLPHYFDVVLTDVPCSGEGMFRKDPAAISEWSPEAVKKCAARQREILRSVWGTLRPGGLLIYSTCTYNTEENEEIAAFICKEFEAEVLPVSRPEEWHVRDALTGSLSVNRFFPHRTKGEGFCLTVFRKPEGEEPTVRERLLRHSGKEKRKAGSEKRKPAIPVEIRSWLNDPESYDFQGDSVGYTAFPEAYIQDLRLLKEQLNVMHAGIRLGNFKGKDIVPDASLALSAEINREAFFRYELTPDEAIRYLRREAVSFPSHVPSGYVLVTCGGVVLGWCKNIGVRANNLYPQEWRIRSGYKPEKIILLSSR